MANFASEVSTTQSAEFFSRFGRFGGDMKLLKQLLEDDDRMKAWMLQAEPAVVVSEDECLVVPVSYQLPPFATLNGVDFDWASGLFDGSSTWEEHESVRGLVDRTPDDRIFLVKRFHRKMKSDQVIAWAKKNGYRAATHEEAIAFAKAHPNRQRKHWIVALGSFALDGGRRHVAVLFGVGRGRYLGLYWFDNDWDVSSGFLLVRK